MVEQFTIPDLPDVKTDVQISRLEGLLKANERLDLLRDRADYIHMRYGQQPKTFYELCAQEQQQQHDAGLPPRSFATAVGVALGVLAVYAYRNHFPKRNDIGYIGGVLSGGSGGFALREWTSNRRELEAVERKLVTYETYLNRFEHAAQAQQPTAALTGDGAFTPPSQEMSR